jgi:hypothetical protein
MIAAHPGFCSGAISGTKVSLSWRGRQADVIRHADRNPSFRNEIHTCVRAVNAVSIGGCSLGSLRLARVVLEVHAWQLG